MTAYGTFETSTDVRYATAFRSSFMAMGNGRHMLPIKADVRKSIGKEAGQTVTIRLLERVTK
jgi:hypothetical protein